jgi:hypothetical protein
MPCKRNQFLHDRYLYLENFSIGFAYYQFFLIKSSMLKRDGKHPILMNTTIILIKQELLGR